MTDAIQLLQQIAAQLQQEGKTPSLVLFRARLTGQLTPQQLFAAYQHWRNHPVYADNLQPQTALQPPPPDDNASTDIAAQLNRIEAKLDALMAKLERP